MAKNIQLKHPVCFECFVEILKQLEFKVKSQEQERDMYKQELATIEKELASSGARGEKELLEELLKLEMEEDKLDKDLESAKKQEENQAGMIEKLTLSKEDIKTQE